MPQPPEKSPKIDPFKPAQPKIPGTSEPRSQRSGPLFPPRIGPFPTWMAATFAGALLVGAVAGWLTLQSEPSAPAAQAEAAAPPPATPQSPPAAFEAEAAGSGPVEVGTTAEFARLWSVKEFRIRKRFSQQIVPAMVIRLPSGSANRVAGYWAFVLEEPFGRCQFEFVSDRNRLEKEFNYAARYPMVVDPCNKSVYDPLRMGTALEGAVTRGAIVAGPAIRPPLAIELRIRGNRIIAVQTE